MILRPRLVAGVMLAALLTVPGGVAAASPHQVDPAGMTPPLNPDWNPWICTDTGNGPVCRAEFHDAWANDDTGLTCDGSAIYSSGTFDSHAVRWHLPDGRAVRTQFHQTATERWSLAPDGSGPALQVLGRWTEHYVYPIPGDRDTRVENWTGIDWHVSAPGYGVVWHDSGYVRFAPGVGTAPEVIHGPADSQHGNLDLVLPDACGVLERSRR